MQRAVFLRKIVLFTFFVFFAGCVSAVQRHPFAVQDMLAMDRISEPKVSPDGSFIVFTLRKTDLEADRGRTDLWLVGVDGSRLKQLTTDPENDSNPCWSPDGKIVYFVSARSGSSQVWKIDIDGGEAQKVTDQPLDMSNLIISPDGKHIAFTIEVFPGLSIEDTKNSMRKKNKNRADKYMTKSSFVTGTHSKMADAHTFL